VTVPGCEEVNCKEVIREISTYLDGELDAGLKQALEAHLKMCHDCKVVFDTTRKTIELYCDGKLFPLPETVHRRLHEVLRRRWQEKVE
jgi:anti-sigma factor RsiW